MSGTVVNYHRLMGRWQPGAQGRLQQAALELFREQGFEQTSVAGIAERAGVTERTFFRHYADKREVLFGGQDEFQAPFLEAIATGPAAASPLGLVTAALEAGCTTFEQRRTREQARARQSVIDAHPALQERELLKLSALSSAMARTLAGRGVAQLPARLAAALAVDVFVAAFGLWLAEGEHRELVALQRLALEQVRAIVSEA